MTETARLLRKVSRRAREHPDRLLPVLRVLAGEAPYDDAAGDEPSPAVLEAARALNSARVARAREEFIEHSYTADQVAELLGVASRQAVAQRRARGGLLGHKIGGRTYYPRWQFGERGVADGLDRLLGLLPAGAVAADDVMRAPHSELGGRTLADLFAAGEWKELEVWLGDIVVDSRAELPE